MSESSITPVKSPSSAPAPEPNQTSGAGGSENTSPGFRIDYKDVTGQKKVYSFFLLPAMESNLQMSPGGLVKGLGASVPKVRPGIEIKTKIAYKKILVAGGAPIIQAIGIDSSMMTLVGAFIGNEIIGSAYEKPNDHPIYPPNRTTSFSSTGDISSTGDNLSTSATKAMREFDREVVQQASEVTVTIQGSTDSADTISYKGVITSAEFFAVKKNRAYYCLNFLQTCYDINKELSASTSSTTNTTNNTPEYYVEFQKQMQKLYPSSYDKVIEKYPDTKNNPTDFWLKSQEDKTVVSQEEFLKVTQEAVKVLPPIIQEASEQGNQ